MIKYLVYDSESDTCPWVYDTLEAATLKYKQGTGKFMEEVQVIRKTTRKPTDPQWERVND